MIKQGQIGSGNEFCVHMSTSERLTLSVERVYYLLTDTDLTISVRRFSPSKGSRRHRFNGGKDVLMQAHSMSLPRKTK